MQTMHEIIAVYVWIYTIKLPSLFLGLLASPPDKLLPPITNGGNDNIQQGHKGTVGLPAPNQLKAVHILPDQARFMDLSLPAVFPPT